jgi:hypothetical protein
MKGDTAMDKTKDAQPKKKGLFALLKESMVKTSEGCGPGCGCHATEEKKQTKDGTATNEGKKE